MFYHGKCRYARGIDERQLEPNVKRKSVGAEVSWGVRFKDESDALKFLDDLAMEVSKRLKEAQVKGRTVTLKVKIRKPGATQTWKHLGHGPCDNQSKSLTLGEYTDEVAILASTGKSLYRQLRIDSIECRGLGLQVTRLDNLIEHAESRKRKNMNSFNRFFEAASSSKHARKKASAAVGNAIGAKVSGQEQNQIDAMVPHALEFATDSETNIVTKDKGSDSCPLGKKDEELQIHMSPMLGEKNESEKEQVAIDLLAKEEEVNASNQSSFKLVLEDTPERHVVMGKVQLTQLVKEEDNNQSRGAHEAAEEMDKEYLTERPLNLALSAEDDTMTENYALNLSTLTAQSEPVGGSSHKEGNECLDKKVEKETCPFQAAETDTKDVDAGEVDSDIGQHHTIEDIEDDLHARRGKSEAAPASNEGSDTLTSQKLESLRLPSCHDVDKDVLDHLPLTIKRELQAAWGQRRPKSFISPTKRVRNGSAKQSSAQKNRYIQPTLTQMAFARSCSPSPSHECLAATKQAKDPQKLEESLHRARSSLFRSEAKDPPKESELQATNDTRPSASSYTPGRGMPTEIGGLNSSNADEEAGPTLSQLDSAVVAHLPTEMRMEILNAAAEASRRKYAK